MTPQAQPSTVVLSYPFEGGLYYLLSRENPWGGGPPIKGHPYYEALYGHDPVTTKNRAVNLLTLFDEVILPPADEYLPGHLEFTSGDQYFNPELGIRVFKNWGFGNEARMIAKQLIDQQCIEGVSGNTPLIPIDKAEFIVGRIIEQVRLAVENNAVIIGGESIGKIASQIWRLVGRDIVEVGTGKSAPQFLTFDDSTFRITALGWDCENIEALKGIRTCKEIKQYSAGFRNALFQAAGVADMNTEMRRLMRSAMSSEALAKKVKGCFETVGLGATSVGVIPMLGTPSAAVGLSSFLASKKAERSEQAHQWYLLGPKIREVELRNILDEDETAPKS
jgi:hypothetical protein